MLPMKKFVTLCVLLLCMSAACFAENLGYPSWDDICDEYSDDQEFLLQKDQYKAQYKAAIDILPFFETMDAEADFGLYFDSYTDEDWNTIYTPFIDYLTDDIWFMFYNMHLESDGLHAFVDVTNMSDDRVGDINLTFRDFVLKSDGSFVSGICSNYSVENNVFYYDNSTFYYLFDASLEETSDGYIVTCNNFELSGAGSQQGVKSGKKGKAVIDWEGNILSQSQ